MKLYKTKSFDEPNGIRHITWSGTQADAAAKRKELKALGDRTEIETKEEDVPTSKPELLAWLNANVTGE